MTRQPKRGVLSLCIENPMQCSKWCKLITHITVCQPCCPPEQDTRHRKCTTQMQTCIMHKCWASIHIATLCWEYLWPIALGIKAQIHWAQTFAYTSTAHMAACTHTHATISCLLPAQTDVFLAAHSPYQTTCLACTEPVMICALYYCMH